MIKKLYIHDIESDRISWENLLKEANLRIEQSIEEVFGLFDQNRLVATASRYHNIIKCVAVAADVQGGSYFNELISHLMNRNFEKGYSKHYVYTKPESQTAFEFLGFQRIEAIDSHLVFMERAINGFPAYLEHLKNQRVNAQSIAAIVMDANPFTLGHQFLIQTAAARHDHVFIFVLSEDQSVFPADVRKQLVIAGTQHLEHVTVLSTDNYMVSHATFPSYFLNENTDVTSIQARLDARVFAYHIAPVLNITTRYVGEEPFSQATQLYNEAMKKEFAGHLNLEIIPRKTVNEHIISATTVRQYLATDQLGQVAEFVPQTTYNWLLTDDGQAVIQRIKEQTHG
ncbi:[citrate (pro-3S)-lyase] ligase [Atopobacter phocae]|uniref:[citrate (pro-3S)-lyase] ligase n=1 Tax=Atopobacter phocae TaxID=136492 RepID=UPI0004719914|nr:[citrate (pro-3S)-lyase] ligase [Atopobacter phocae]